MRPPASNTLPRSTLRVLRRSDRSTPRNAPRIASACAALALGLASRAHAHPGHGIELPHLHGHDLALLVVLGAITVIGIVSALSGRK